MIKKVRNFPDEFVGWVRVEDCIILRNNSASPSWLLITRSGNVIHKHNDLYNLLDLRTDEADKIIAEVMTEAAYGERKLGWLSKEQLYNEVQMNKLNELIKIWEDAEL